MSGARASDRADRLGERRPPRPQPHAWVAPLSTVYREHLHETDQKIYTNSLQQGQVDEATQLECTPNTCYVCVRRISRISFRDTKIVEQKKIFNKRNVWNSVSHCVYLSGCLNEYRVLQPVKITGAVVSWYVEALRPTVPYITCWTFCPPQDRRHMCILYISVVFESKEQKHRL